MICIHFLFNPFIFYIINQLTNCYIQVSDFTAVLVVDNLPRVTTAKFEKLCEVLRGKIQNFGAKLAGEDWIFMPFGTDNLTEGYAVE